MIDLIEKRKKQERLEIAERKVEKAWVRASKINTKLKHAKRIDNKNITDQLKEDKQDALKRLKRNKKELKLIERKIK